MIPEVGDQVVPFSIITAGSSGPLLFYHTQLGDVAAMLPRVMLSTERFHYDGITNPDSVEGLHEIQGRVTKI